MMISRFYFVLCFVFIFYAGASEAIPNGKNSADSILPVPDKQSLAFPIVSSNAPPVPTLGNYIFCYDTTTQLLDAANTYQTIHFNTQGTSATNSWVYSNPTFTCQTAGAYHLEYRCYPYNISILSNNIAIQAIKNGVEIPGSNSSIAHNAGGIPASAPLTGSCFVDLVPSDTIEIQWAATSAPIALSTLVVGTATHVSASVTITRIN